MKLSHPVVDLCIVCSNFEESLTFYRDKLGFEVVLDIDIPEDLATGIGLAPQGFRQVRLQAGETLIKLMDIGRAAAAANFPICRWGALAHLLRLRRESGVRRIAGQRRWNFCPSLWPPRIRRASSVP